MKEYAWQELITGSLNIRLDQEIDMPPHSKELVRIDHEGRAIIYIAPAMLNDVECFAVINKKAEEGSANIRKILLKLSQPIIYALN